MGNNQLNITMKKNLQPIQKEKKFLKKLLIEEWKKYKIQENKLILII